MPDGVMEMLQSGGMISVPDYLFDHLADYPCKVTNIPGLALRKFSRSMGYKKDWPYKDLFDFFLHRIDESGQFTILRRKASTNS